ncbi:MAG: YitT family protein [Proteocatella sp.]
MIRKNITSSEFAMIILGSLLLALGITWFLSPLGLVTGGISGIAILVQEVTSPFIANGVPIWFTNAVLNIPLFVISIRQRGFAFAKKSLYAVVALSFALWLTEMIPNPMDVGEDLLLASLFGGVLVGAGVGLVLKAGGTTGGTDMLAAIFKFKRPNLPIENVMLAIDATIIMSGMFVFGPINVMYAIISVLVTTKLVSVVLEGGHSAKAVFIVSQKSNEIAELVMSDIGRGATGIKAKGMYLKKESEMLFVVLSQKELPELREIVLGIDAKAFVTIAEVREVLGQGFIENYDPHKL